MPHLDVLASGHATDSHLIDFLHTEQCIPIMLAQQIITTNYNVPKVIGAIVDNSIPSDIASSDLKRVTINRGFGVTPITRLPLHDPARANTTLYLGSTPITNSGFRRA